MSASPQLALVFSYDGGSTVVTIRGAVTATTSMCLGQALELTVNDHDVVIDARDLTTIDGAGFSVLSRAVRDVRAGALSIRNLEPPTAECVERGDTSSCGDLR